MKIFWLNDIYIYVGIKINSSICNFLNFLLQCQSYIYFNMIGFKLNIVDKNDLTIYNKTNPFKMFVQT